MDLTPCGEFYYAVPIRGLSAHPLKRYADGYIRKIDWERGTDEVSLYYAIE
jgi:hypothetical protein